VLEEQQAWKEEKERKEVDKDKVAEAQQRVHLVFFRVGHSGGWADPVHQTWKHPWGKHGLTWLQITMFCHKSSNLHELLQGNLSKKANQGVPSLDFMECQGSCHKQVTTWSLREAPESVAKNEPVCGSIPRPRHPAPFAGFWVLWQESRFRQQRNRTGVCGCCMHFF